MCTIESAERTPGHGFTEHEGRSTSSRSDEDDIILTTL